MGLDETVRRWELGRTAEATGDGPLSSLVRKPTVLVRQRIRMPRLESGPPFRAMPQWLHSGKLRRPGMCAPESSDLRA